MRILLRSALALLPLFLAGCFFENPLTSKPSDNLNTWLLGEWEHRDKNGAVSRALVTPLSKDTYRVDVSLAKRGGGRTYNFEAWGSRVGEFTFHTLRNMQPAPDLPEGAFIFLHAQLVDQNTITLRVPILTSPQSSISKSLRSELRARLKDNALFEPGKEKIWKRTSEVYWERDGQTGLFRPLRYLVPDPQIKTKTP